MADLDFHRMPPWTETLEPGLYGAITVADPVLVTHLKTMSSVSVIARRGAAVPDIVGLAVPATGRWVENEDIRIASDGPDQWRVVSESFDEGALYKAVKAAAGSSASVIDQSHGWVTIQVSGEMMPDVLAKGTSLDTHLDAFGVGQCAATQIAHMMVHVTCLDDHGPTYVFQMFRSMADSFGGWLRDSAAPYGVRIGS
ncbi:MAG: sarcosine oxidase subunit gamma [Hyphomicrobiaceae bacterium]